MGAIGDAVTDIKTDLINRNRAIHQKGTADAPGMSNVFASASRPTLASLR
jgi:hypothetical protein